MHPEKIIFIHIPKVAGRTMHSIVARQYPPDAIFAIEGRLGQERIPSPEDARRTKIVIGLVHYGFHQHLLGPSRYVTLLRDPVSRVLSLYHYIVTNPRHYLHEKVINDRLLDFVSGEADAEEIENGQTRQIAGVREGTLDRSSLISAKKNLTEAFAAVGLVERFDESIILFKRRLGWRLPFYVRKNVTPRFGAEEANGDALRVIRERNTLDTDLYQFGRNLFEDQVRREGPLFHVEVSLFQTLNAGARVYRAGREMARGLRRKQDRDM